MVDGVDKGFLCNCLSKSKAVSLRSQVGAEGDNHP